MMHLQGHDAAVAKTYPIVPPKDFIIDFVPNNDWTKMRNYLTSADFKGDTWTMDSQSIWNGYSSSIVKDVQVNADYGVAFRGNKYTSSTNKAEGHYLGKFRGNIKSACPIKRIYANFTLPNFKETSTTSYTHPYWVYCNFTLTFYDAASKYVGQDNVITIQGMYNYIPTNSYVDASKRGIRLDALTILLGSISETETKTYEIDINNNTYPDLMTKLNEWVSQSTFMDVWFYSYYQSMQSTSSKVTAPHYTIPLYWKKLTVEF